MTETNTEVIGHDLARKLSDDVRWACRQFVMRCDEGGVDGANVVSHLLSVLTATTFEAMDKLGLPDETFTEAVQTWRKLKADKLATDKTLN